MIQKKFFSRAVALVFVSVVFVFFSCSLPTTGDTSSDQDAGRAITASPNLHQISTWYSGRVTVEGVAKDRYMMNVKNYGGTTKKFRYWFDVNGSWWSGYFTQTLAIGKNGVVTFFCDVTPGKAVSTVEMSGVEEGYFIAPDDITP